MSLSISGLSPRTMICEVRHADAYRLWDRAGELWIRASKVWSGLTMTEASPGKIVFGLDGRYSMGVELKQAVFRDHSPARNAEIFAQMADSFIGLHCEVLEISRLTRVGFRVVYWKDYPTVEAAADAIHSLRFVSLPSGPHFGVESNPREHNYLVRYEDETVGVALRLSNIGLKAEIVIPVEVAWSGLSESKIERVALQLDIDYYTTKPSDAGQLSVKEWIMNADHIIRRDTDIFLST